MNVLVIEDDALIAEFIIKVLEKDNHFVQVEYDGEIGFKRAQSSKYDAIILDIMLPTRDGLSICRELRRLKVSTPILILSSHAEEDFRVEGLDSGADDYLIKPFSYKELLARIRSITRRPSIIVQSKLKVHDLELHPDSRKVNRGDIEIILTPKEYDLLEFFMRNPDTALPRYILLNKVWSIRSDASSNRLEVYIKHLRHKIDHPFKKKLIHTVRGVGYKITTN